MNKHNNPLDDVVHLVSTLDDLEERFALENDEDARDEIWNQINLTESEIYKLTLDKD
jgi:hypothetical protein